MINDLEGLLHGGNTPHLISKVYSLLMDDAPKPGLYKPREKWESGLGVTMGAELWSELLTPDTGWPVISCSTKPEFEIHRNCININLRYPAWTLDVVQKRAHSCTALQSDSRLPIGRWVSEMNGFVPLEKNTYSEMTITLLQRCGRL